MPIDLNKDKNELKYYYSENGATLGPHSLSQLLERIDAETLVYREGIEWTNAKAIDELKKFFKEQQVKEEYASNIAQFASITESLIEPRKMFAAPFSFEGRIRRLEHGISTIIYYIIYFIVLGISTEAPIMGLAMIPIIWFILAQGAKRCHDRGNSGWYQIIPFYIFWMLFAEGDKEANEYGNPPKK
jgi:uncharacterized membrane protein YhaH (DUF805 family)